MTYSIITTCKGRLHYLLQSLPSFLAQKNAEVIVVDFDCPQDTAAVMARDFPAVRTVHIPNQPVFRLSVARNAGAAIARGDRLLFVDADIVLRDDFTERMEAMPDGTYGECIGPNDVRGTCVVPREAFERICGYDEVISGYGAEDLDLYARLLLAKMTRHTIDLAYIREVLPNTPEERIQFHDVGRRIGFIRGQIYRETKALLMKFEQSLEIDIRLRRELWANVDALIRSPAIFEHEHTLEVPLPSTDRGPMLGNGRIDLALRVTVKLAK